MLSACQTWRLDLLNPPALGYDALSSYEEGPLPRHLGREFPSLITAVIRQLQSVPKAQVKKAGKETNSR